MTTFQYNGHSYLLSNSGTWQKAQAEAQRLGGNLVTINDQAEQDWLTTTFSGKNLWIGYTDQATEGVFKWISGENSTYTYWNGGEPNNWQNEDYAHLWASGGRWNDLPNSLSVYTPMRGIIELADDSIFNAQGSGIKEAGVIRVMADFSKAAYALQSWEDHTDFSTDFSTGLNAAFNDKSNGADTAYQDILSQGWKPLAGSDLGITQTNTTYNALDHSTGNWTPFSVIDNMENGYYTHANVAAFVARSDDSIVLSFRGTNDNRKPDDDSGETNQEDTNNNIRPDVDHWGQIDASGYDSDFSMSDHYAFFSPLISALNTYVSNNENGIAKVYVTGHSLGGAMAIEYMANHPDDNRFQAVTFAAPAVTSSDGWRQSFKDDSRVTQIEITADPVPQTWDVAVDHTRPGHVIHFSGQNTLDTPDNHSAFGVGFKGNDSNHSMDYYRTITDNIDANSWQTILKPTTLAQISNQDVYLGGTRAVSNRVETFTVATNADVLTVPTDSNYNIIYGGGGNDTLTGGKANELLIGGRGRDVLRGELGEDTFVFNTVSDSGAVSKLRDVIIDFLTGTDKIDLSGMDANNTTAENDAFLSLTTGVKNVTFNLTNALYFNTASHILYGNNDTDTAADFSISLSGVTSLTTSDFIL